jgi:hypothetical protein
MGAFPSVCMQYNNVAVRLYTGNGSGDCDDTAILCYTLIKTATNTEVRFAIFEING